MLNYYDKERIEEMLNYYYFNILPESEESIKNADKEEIIKILAEQKEILGKIFTEITRIIEQSLDYSIYFFYVTRCILVYV